MLKHQRITQTWGKCKCDGFWLKGSEHWEDCGKKKVNEPHKHIRNLQVKSCAKFVEKKDNKVSAVPILRGERGGGGGGCDRGGGGVGGGGGGGGSLAVGRGVGGGGGGGALPLG